MTALIQMNHITKKFGKGKNAVMALKDVHFQANPGEFISIIGPSGSGKSTFLTIAGGLQTPTTGDMIINKTNFAKLPEKKRAQLRFKEIGFILQTSNLIPFLTIEEQFIFVDKLNKVAPQQKKIHRLLHELDVEKLAKSYPRDLSGGERQRVAIGRALYNNPSLILADEPTASLDTPHAFAVVELLKQEAHKKNKATIMVTHDQRMIEGSDKIFMIVDGVLSTYHPDQPLETAYQQPTKSEPLQEHLPTQKKKRRERKKNHGRKRKQKKETPSTR